MAKKIRKIQIFRHLVQLVMFFLLPGLYIMAFSELKNIYQMFIKGDFSFLQAFPGLIEFFIVILMTIILGRFFCGWFCAFGAYNDLIHEISKNVFKVKYKVDSKVDSVLKYIKYVVLVFLIAIIWTTGSKIFSTASPWDAFAQITDFPHVMSEFTIGFMLLTLITIGAFFIERFFCRYLCPLGAVFSIFSKIGLFKINKPNEKCGNCRACTNNCSMGIALYKVNEVKGGECINCLKCIEVCPRKNASANLLDENINPALASSIAIATFAGIYGLNQFGAAVLTNSGITAEKANISLNSINNSSSSNAASNPAVKYKDGTYQGTGTGFRGGTTEVSVTISGGKISDIETISEEDTSRFYQRAKSVLPDEIISAQSASVDAVSGATYSSRGIMDAVADALNKAV